MQNEATLQQIFAERLLAIPAYQRGYAWESRHRQDFLDDLELLAPNKDHYTGTIVLHARTDLPAVHDDSDAQLAQFDVVDGQQRLTTALLLIDAIRREFHLMDDRTDLAMRIGQRFIAVRQLNGQPTPRLRLNPDCDGFWRDVLIANALGQPASPLVPTIASHERLRDGAAEFDAYLRKRKGELAADWPDWLHSLYRKVSQQLKFVVYPVQDDAEVGVIFEVMNNRGKQLSELEKVKNYLLYLAHKLDLDSTDLAHSINLSWAEILQNLMAAGLSGGGDEDGVLRVHWLTHYSHDLRKWKQVQSVKEQFALKSHVGKHLSLLSKLTEYTRTLRNVALAYSDAARPGRDGAFKDLGDYAADVRFWSEKLCRVRLGPFLPLLVATRLRFPADGAKYLEMLKFCELFAFRVYSGVSRHWRSNAGQSTLRWRAQQLNSGESSFESIMMELHRVLLEYAPDAEFDHDLRREGDDWYNWRSIRYFLYEYEEHLTGPRAVRLQWSEIERRDLAKTIEHILPQNPDLQAWITRFHKEDRELWTHDIGNLVLTYDNSSLGRKNFADKKGLSGQVAPPCYANSQLAQERELAKFDDWTVETARQRHADLTEWAIGRWRVPAKWRNAAPSEAAAILQDDDDGEAE